MVTDKRRIDFSHFIRNGQYLEELKRKEGEEEVKEFNYVGSMINTKVDFYATSKTENKHCSNINTADGQDLEERAWSTGFSIASWILSFVGNSLLPIFYALFEKLHRLRKFPAKIRPNFDEFRWEQRTNFDEIRSHYFCTVLYFKKFLKKWSIYQSRA